MHYAFQGCTDVHVTPEKGMLDVALCLCTCGEPGALPVHSCVTQQSACSEPGDSTAHRAAPVGVTSGSSGSVGAPDTPEPAPAPVLGWHHYPGLSAQVLGLLLLLFAQQCQTCRGAKVCSCIYCKS